MFSLVHWSPLTLGKGLVAPAWANTLGWLLTFSSVSLLPTWAIYALATTPGTLAQVTPALPLYNFAPGANDDTVYCLYINLEMSKHSTKCNFLTSPQRFQHLCSPANSSSLALRHPPTNNSALPYSPALPLPEKPKEQRTDVI